VKSAGASTEAAVLTRPGARLEVQTLGLPPLRAGQVLVDVAFSGVCGSQLLEARGLRGEDRYVPHTLGHEGSGTVRGVGPGVTKVAAGDRVVLTWIAGEGANVPSARYEGPGGAVNSGAISTFMRAAVVSENRVVRVPAETPLREAALLGCAVPTGAGAVLNTGRAAPGDSVAVFGVGGVGLAAVLGARLVHADPIIAVDIAAAKLEQARRAGATHAVNAGALDAVEAVRGLSGGAGVDLAIEAAGLARTMEAAFASVRERGGLCVIAGNVPHGGRITLDPFDLIRGRRIVGTWGGDTRPDHDIPTYARLFLSGRLDLGALPITVYPLESVNDALDDLESGRVGRALLDMALSQDARPGPPTAEEVR